MIAAGDAFQACAQIVLHSGRKLAVTRVGQPGAAGNVQPLLPAPNGAGGKIGRTRNIGHGIDKSPGSSSPDGVRLRGRDHSGAL